MGSFPKYGFLRDALTIGLRTNKQSNNTFSTKTVVEMPGTQKCRISNQNYGTTMVLQWYYNGTTIVIIVVKHNGNNSSKNHGNPKGTPMQRTALKPYFGADPGKGVYTC